MAPGLHGATATDTLDGNLTNQVTITGTVDVNSTGAYVLTYSVSDGAGNDSNVTRTVNVGMASTHTVQGASNLQMLWVEPGTFTMGSPTSEAGHGSNETEHNVTLTKGFYLGKYEVTQAQYEAVMTGNSNSLSATPSEWPNNPNRPVEKVSWDDAQIFLTRLNAAEQTAGRLPAGWSYVLPTESEWEYACRTGTTLTPLGRITTKAESARPATSVSTRPTRGVSSTCTETSGNGVRTGTEITQLVQCATFSAPITPAARWRTTLPFESSMATSTSVLALTAKVILTLPPAVTVEGLVANLTSPPNATEQIWVSRTR
jgi:hypothetical protein